MSMPLYSPRTKHQYARHLDSALEDDDLDFYYTHPSIWKYRYKRIPHEYIRPRPNGFIGNQHIFRSLEKYLVNSFSIEAAADCITLGKLLNVVSSAIDLQLQAIIPSSLEPIEGLLSSKMAPLYSHPDVGKTFRYKKLVLAIHQDIAQIADKNVYPSRIPSAPNLILHTNMVIVETVFGPPVVIPYNFLLAVLDKLESRFLVTVYAVLAGSSPLHSGLNYYDYFNKMYLALDEAVDRFGSQSSRILKVLEPVAVGVTLQQGDPDVNDHSFLTTIVEDFSLANPTMAGSLRYILSLMQQLIADHGDKAIPAILESYGQEKMHYYPIVTLEAGLVKMYRFGTSVRRIDIHAVRELVGQLKKEWIQAKYHKDGQLPPLVLPKGSHPALQAMIANNQVQSARHCDSIPLNDWEKVICTKAHDFNYFPDTLDLLDDKGISPPLSKMNQIFAVDALKAAKRSPVIQPSNTRLIIEALSRPEVDVQSYYQQIEINGRIPKDWTLIQLKAKERELKEAPRDFSILSFECRMAASVCERNIADQILSLFSTHSMSSSGSELRGKIDVMANLENGPDHTWVTYHLDIEQWNYTFRSTLVAPFIHFLNSIFGVEHFSLAIRLFSQGTLQSAGKYAVPQLSDQFTGWNTHAGGNQGIFQKLWTLITIMVIRRTLLKGGWDHVMTGAGDNQVVSVKIMHTPELQADVLRVKQALAAGFEEVGLSVKLAETWHSSMLLAYQRRYFLRGIPVPNAIKQGARSFAGLSDMDSGVNSTISTAMNAGINISEATSDPLLGIIVAYVEAYTVLMCSPQFLLSTKMRFNKLPFLALAGSELGLLPFVQLPTFLYSGHKDALSESLGIICRLWDLHPAHRPNLSWLLSWETSPPTDEVRLQMITDPGSLNIKRPSSAEGFIRKQVEEYLMTPANVKNKQFRRVFHHLSMSSQVALSKLLLSIKPIHLNLCQALFEYSQIGHVVALLGKFNKLSSIVKLVNSKRLHAQQTCFASQVRALDAQMITTISMKSETMHSLNSSFPKAVLRDKEWVYNNWCQLHKLPPHCTFSLRMFLVPFTYGLLPLMIKGPFLPPPTEQLIFHSSLKTAPLSASILIHPAASTPSEWHLRESTQGPFRLYIGSKTKDPVRSIKLTNLEGLESGKALKVLMKLFAWSSSGGSSQSVLDCISSLIGSRVPGLGDILTQLSAGTAGGTFSHRFDTPGSVMGCYTNSGTMISTWIQLVTNQATQLQRGEEDRYIFFQQLFQHIYSVLRLVVIPSNSLAAEVNMVCCSLIVDDQPFSGGGSAETLIAPYTGDTCVPEASRVLLQQEAQYSHMMQHYYSLTGHDGSKLLASYIAHKQIQIMVQYNAGVWNKQTKAPNKVGPQDYFSVTVLRSVPLLDLLAALVAQMLYQKVFGRVNSWTGLIRILTQELSTPSGTTDAAMYQDLLDGLIVSGHLPQLAHLSGRAILWDQSPSHIVLLPNLILGMIKAAESLRTGSCSTILLAEFRFGALSWDKLWTFCRRTSSAFRSWEKNNSAQSARSKLERYRAVTRHVTILPITDVELALERGRASMRSQPAPQASVAVRPLLDGPLLIALCPVWQPVAQSRISPASLSNLNEIDCEKLKELISNTPTALKYMHQLGKWTLCSSGARSKLLEIVLQLPVPLPQGSLVVSLAEGAGSYLGTLLHLIPHSLGVYNSLILPEDHSHSYSGLFVPPELICEHDIQDRVVNLPYSPFHSGDLTKPGTTLEIVDIVKQYPGRPLVLTLDMEGFSPSRGGAIRQTRSLISMIDPDTCILKLFLEDLRGQTLLDIYSLVSQYTEGLFIKPSSSSLHSSEFFLVLQKTAHDNPTLSEVSGSHFILQWSIALSGLDMSLECSKQILLAVWTRGVTFCPTMYPSTSSSTAPEFHPITSILCRLISLVDETVSSIVVEEEHIPRAHLHMKQSSTKGAQATYDSGMSLVLVLNAFCKAISSNPWVHDPLDYSTRLIHSTDVVLNCLDKAEQLKIPEAMLRLMMRQLGELWSSRNPPECEHFVYLLRYTLWKWTLIPESWNLKQLGHLLPTWMIPLLDGSPFAYPLSTYLALESSSVREPLVAWVDLVTQEMRPSPLSIQCSPSSLHMWLIVLGVTRAAPGIAPVSLLLGWTSYVLDYLKVHPAPLFVLCLDRDGHRVQIPGYKIKKIASLKVTRVGFKMLLFRQEE